MVKKEEDNSYSFKGYSFKEWVSRNSTFIKAVFVTVATLITALSVNLDPRISVSITGLAALGSKLACDGIDFYIQK